MVMTVKLDDSRKQALDRFLASLIIKSGVKVSLQEILGLMVDYSPENRDELVKRIKKLPPLQDDHAPKMLKEPDNWGGPHPLSPGGLHPGPGYRDFYMQILYEIV
jgi:hypothetical protein